MAVPRLQVVSSELPEPPYPPDTEAGGWHPQFHIDRITASDTWMLAEDDERPWLLRVWFEAWRSVPVGTMPSDRKLFARRIGCKVAFLDAHAEILLRGWVLHSDGALYHWFIASQVLDMLKSRAGGRQRVAKYREQQRAKAEALKADNASKDGGVTSYDAPCNANVPVTNVLVTPLKGREGKGREEEESPTDSCRASPTTRDAEAILAYLNEKAGSRFQPVKANIDRIKARLREYDAETLRGVVDRKCAQWRTDEKMCQYLRPATLFGAEKCAQYVGETARETTRTSTPTSLFK